ncbi:MAG: methyltransferase [Candidatus Marithrix sp.]
MHSINTGTSSFENVYGMNRYKYNQQNPDSAELFNRAMAELSVIHDNAILAVYDFANISKLADIAGGQRSLLTAILQKYPNLQGTLFDQKYTIDKAKDLFVDIKERCNFVAGNFFESVPVGLDVYMLKNILHNWNDQQAIQILKNCYQAMPKTGQLLVIETVINDDSSWRNGIKDLNMLVMLSSGKVRTESDKLFTDAGFKLTNIIPTTIEMSLIKGN